MRDDHAELKLGQNNVLNAVAAVDRRLESQPTSDAKFTKFDFYWRLGVTVTAAIVGFFAAIQGGLI